MEPLAIVNRLDEGADGRVGVLAITVGAGIDLFRIPENDNTAPNTEILDAPTGISNPHDARVRVTGADSEIPQELLQYQVTVNGVTTEPSFVREFSVGEAGKSGTYEVQVADVSVLPEELLHDGRHTGWSGRSKGGAGLRFLGKCIEVDGGLGAHVRGSRGSR